MANLASLVKRFDPGKMLGGAISSGVGRFRSNIGSGDKGYRVMMRGYSTIKSFERRFASRDSGKSRPAGPAGGPTRRPPSTSPSAPSGAPARTDHIAAGEEFTHKGNVYIVPEGHVFDTRSGRLIADPATSKSRSFVSFAKAGVIMQSSFDNFKTITFRKLDKIIDLVSKLQPSPVVAAPLEEVKKPEEVGAPEKEKPSNWLPFLAGMLSGLGLKYFVRPLVQLFKRIMKWITGLWTAVRKLFTRIANAIISAFKRFWQFMTKIKNAFLRVVNFIKNLIPKAWEALKDIGKRIGKFFTDKFTAAKDFIVKRLTAVKDYLIKLGARALVWLGKMIMKVAPVLAPMLKGVAGKAVAAAQRGVARASANTPAARAANLATNGPGMKLLRTMARIPGAGLLIEAGFAIYDIREADDKFAIDKDKIAHNKAVSDAIVGAMGRAGGAAIGAFIGVALTKGLIAGGAIAGTVVPGAGNIVGALLGLGVGVASTLALTVGGAVAGEWALKKVMDHYGDPQAFGAAVNSALEAFGSDDIKRANEMSLELNKQIEELNLGESARLSSASIAAKGTLNKMLMQRLINQSQYKELHDRITKAGIEGVATRDERDRLHALAATMRGVADEYSPRANIGLMGGHQGRTDRQLSGQPVQSGPPSVTPPTDAPDGSQPDTSVQPVPVPPQTPPEPDQQRDEFGGTIIINSQTNNRHTTAVATGQSAPMRRASSPDPWQWHSNIGL